LEEDVEGFPHCGVIIHDKNLAFSGSHKRFGTSLRSPLLARWGGRAIKRNIAKLPLMERTGWWFMIQRNVLEPDPPPRLPHFGGFAFLLTGAATPPGQEGRCSQDSK